MKTVWAIANISVTFSGKGQYNKKYNQTFNKIKLYKDDETEGIYDLSTITKEFNESILNFTGRIEFSYFQG